MGSELDEKVSLLIKQLDPKVLASTIDHTLLAPTATRADIKKLCNEALEIGAGSVCVQPYRVSEARAILEGTGVAVCTVVGFPLGADIPFFKVLGASHAIDSGATEIDMVGNVGALKDGNLGSYQAEVAATARTVYGKGGLLKVIIETCYLTDREKAEAAVIVSEVGKEVGCQIFIKTSTGFGTPKQGPNGATYDDVALLRREAGSYGERNHVGVKASGGVRDAQTALRMIAAAGGLKEDGTIYSNLRDVVRIGTSSGVKIVDEYKALRGK